MVWLGACVAKYQVVSDISEDAAVGEVVRLQSYRHRRFLLTSTDVREATFRPQSFQLKLRCNSVSDPQLISG